MIIYKGMVEQGIARKEMEAVRTQMDVFKRCGLEQERKKLLERYNELVIKCKEYDGIIDAQRRKSAHALLVCFVAADLATLAADQFASVCDEVNLGLNKSDNEFVKMMRYNAATSAMRWNDVVRLIDEGEDNRLSEFYADFSEAITDEVLPLINKAVNDVMNTAKGRKLL